MSKLFLDTEFTELSQQAQLLSLALVSEDERWFYAEFTDVDTNGLSEWHQEHVVPHLSLSEQQISQFPSGGTYLKATKPQIVSSLKEWLQQWTHIEIWADVPAFDWVLFCELFGGALHIPKQIHYVVRDLATLFILRGYDADTDRFEFAYRELGNRPEMVRHNALADAWTASICYRKMMKN